MPQTNEGVLLLIGAVFFLIGLLGGGFEISAIKIPSIGKFPRYLSSGLGVIFMGLAIVRLMFPPLPPQPTIASTVTETPIPPTHTPLPQIDTPTPIPPTDTPMPTTPPRPTATPTATIDADPTVYDNFNNPANDGGFNNSRWKFNDPEGVCSVAQNEGMMTFSMNSSDTEGNCFLFGPKDISGTRLQLFEAKIQISTFKGGSADTKLTMVSDGFSGGGWIMCGLGADREGINAFINVTKNADKGGTTEFERTYPIEFNRWYTIRYEVDPNSMTFSCFVDNNLIGTVVPEDAPRFETASFGRYIQTAISPNSSATIFVDDVRVVP